LLGSVPLFGGFGFRKNNAEFLFTMDKLGIGDRLGPEKILSGSKSRRLGRNPYGRPGKPK